jgi:uncharacterized membrane protein YeaQ/YmgE (transglycosylase-associated protein family)
MYFLSWTIVGLVAGWAAGKILNSDRYGPLMDIAMGIGGAVAGGYLMHSAGFSGRYRGTIYTTLVAINGAVILTLLGGLVNGRRLSARQL